MSGGGGEACPAPAPGLLRALPGAELRGDLGSLLPWTLPQQPSLGLAHLPAWSWPGSLSCLHLAALTPEPRLWRLAPSLPWDLFTVPAHQQISITRIPSPLLPRGPGLRPSHTTEDMP